LRKAVDQFGVKEAYKVAVEPFVAAEEFIAEVEARHELALFEPEYGAERAQEENAFGIVRCNHTCGKTGIGIVAPFESPVGFVLDVLYCFDGMEQVQFSFLGP
jgi:hypothetical protein